MTTRYNPSTSNSNLGVTTICPTPSATSTSRGNSRYGTCPTSSTTTSTMKQQKNEHHPSISSPSIIPNVMEQKIVNAIQSEKQQEVNYSEYEGGDLDERGAHSIRKEMAHPPQQQQQQQQQQRQQEHEHEHPTIQTVVTTPVTYNDNDEHEYTTEQEDDDDFADYRYRSTCYNENDTSINNANNDSNNETINHNMNMNCKDNRNHGRDGIIDLPSLSNTTITNMDQRLRHRQVKQYSWIVRMYYYMFGTTESTQKTMLLLLVVLIGIALLFIGKDSKISDNYHTIKVHNEQVLDTMVVKASNDMKSSLVYQAFHDAVSSSSSASSNNGGGSIESTTNNNNNNNNENDGGTTSSNVTTITIKNNNNNSNIETTTTTTTITTTTITRTKTVPRLIEIHENYQTFHKLFLPSISTGFCTYLVPSAPISIISTPTPTTLAPTTIVPSSQSLAPTSNTTQISSLSSSTTVSSLLSFTSSGSSNRRSRQRHRHRQAQEMESVQKQKQKKKQQQQQQQQDYEEPQEQQEKQVEERIEQSMLNNSVEEMLEETKSSRNSNVTPENTDISTSVVDDDTTTMTTTTTTSTSTSMSATNGNNSSSNDNEIKYDNNNVRHIFDVSIDCTKLFHLSAVRGVGNWLSFYYKMRLVLLSQRHSSILFTCTDYSFDKDTPKDHILPWLSGWFPSSIIVSAITGTIPPTTTSTEVVVAGTTKITTSTTTTTAISENGPINEQATTTITTTTTTAITNSTGSSSSSSSSSNNFTATSIPTKTSTNESSSTSLQSSISGIAGVQKQVQVQVPTVQEVCNVSSAIMYDDWTPIVPIIKQDLRRMALGLIGVHPDPNHPSTLYAQQHHFVTDTSSSSTTVLGTGSSSSLTANSADTTNATGSNSNDSMERIAGSDSTRNNNNYNSNIDIDIDIHDVVIDPTRSIYTVPSSHESPLLSKTELDDVIVHFPCIESVFDGTGNFDNDNNQNNNNNNNDSDESSSSTTTTTTGSSSSATERRRSEFYGFFKFSLLAKYISPEARTIGILTQTLNDENDGESLGPRCRAIIDELIIYIGDYLASSSSSLCCNKDGNEETSIMGESNSSDTHSQSSCCILPPKITIRDGNTETMAITRIIMANQTIASISTFSMLASMATFGTAYIPQSTKVDWIVQKSSSSSYNYYSPEHHAVNSNTIKNSTNNDTTNSTTSDAMKGSDENNGQRRQENHQHLQGQFSTSFGQHRHHDGIIQVIEGGYPYFLKIEDAILMCTEPDGEEQLLEWFRNDTYWFQ